MLGKVPRREASFASARIQRMRKLLPILLLFCVSVSALERQPNQAYRARREALAKKADNGVVVLFGANEASTGDAIWGFHQEANFYYLTGWPEPGAALLIAPATSQSPTQRTAQPPHGYIEILFLPARNKVQERWTGEKLGPDSPNATSVTGFDKVEELSQLPTELAKFLPGVVFTDQPGYRQKSEVHDLTNWLQTANLAAGARFQDVHPLLDELRQTKDPGEIALIRKATDASVAAHFAAMHALKPGMNEREIAALMQYEFERRGCERPAYAPIVGAGFNSTVLHYSADSGPIRDGDVVVMDVAGEYSGYASDITRTLPANGHFTARQREIYNIVLGAQQAAIDAFQSGKSTLRGENSLYDVAMQYINTHGKDLHGEPLGKYFIHGLSHMVGLDVHDPGLRGQVLLPRMVFTIEPGIYIPEEKLGVRIEDDFLVGPNGKLINLSGALPRSAEDVERTMRENGARGTSASR
jgi:Xaa-Pro aminopeptidase